MKKLAFRSSLALLAVIFLAVGCAPPEITSARLYIRNKDWPSARASLEQALQQYPDNAEAHKLMADVELQARNWEAARDHYRAAERLGTPQMKQQVEQIMEGQWVQQYNIAVSMLNRGDHQRAIELFEIATKLIPERTPAWNNMAICYAQIDSIDMAIAMYNQVLVLEPDNRDVRKNIGFMYFNNQEYEKAVEYLQVVADEDISDGSVVSALGVCYVQLERKQEALALYERAIEADPDNVEVLFNLAFLYVQEGNDELALPYLLRLIEADPFDGEAMQQIGFIYMNVDEPTQEDLDRAFPYLLKASELNPNNFITWRFLGMYYIRSGDLEKGREAMNRADQLEELQGGDPPPTTPPTIPPVR